MKREAGHGTQGHKGFDADTHVGPAADILMRYLTAQERAGRAAAIPWAASSTAPTLGRGDDLEAVVATS